MHVLTWSAGAIGGTIGAYLSRTGHQVRLVDRDQAHVKMMHTRGLQITGPVDACSSTKHRSTLAARSDGSARPPALSPDRDEPPARPQV